nr:MAG: DNA pilot protein [Microviridae sp.]
MSAADFAGAGGSVVSSIAGGLFGLMGGQQANAANAQQAQIQRDWEQNMFQTRYQNTVNDLRAAGLNPMLAFEGSGPSTPSGATSPAMQNVMSAGVSNAAEAGQATSALATAALTREGIQKENEVKSAQARLLDAQTKTEDNKPENIFADTAFKYAQSGASRGSATLSNSQSNWIDTQRDNYKHTLDLIDSETKRNASSAANLNTLTTNEALMTPERQAYADKYKSTIGHYIAPWLGEAHDAISAGATAYGAGRVGKYLKDMPKANTKTETFRDKHINIFNGE